MSSSIQPTQPTPSSQQPIDERTARLALTRMGEPGNEALQTVIASRGVRDTVAALISGRLVVPGVFGERYSRAQALQDQRNGEQVGARLIIPQDPDWPRAVNDLRAPPLCLWVRGDLHLPRVAERSIAIVGARSATQYGTHTAADLAVGLGERGFAIVSGAAFGIDAAAHRGALATDAPTVAVMAGGIDRLYPAAHTGLLHEIARVGAVISEQPPGVAPIGSRFLKRNRLIAAISCGTVVVEASLRSGSFNTAHHAVETVRPVGAVPGPVTSMQSAGCHQLIREGKAELVTDAAEVAELVGRMGFDLAPVKRGQSRATDALEEFDRIVYEALPMTKFIDVDALSASVNGAVMTVRAALGRLGLQGFAENDGGDGWRKPKR
ncbi:MAG: DNA-processing protein DprA [Actinomycetia bacterium]|nr:DNA-processing protein DprA [Actinomycetes bacterium]